MWLHSQPEWARDEKGNIKTEKGKVKTEILKYKEQQTVYSIPPVVSCAVLSIPREIVVALRTTCTNKTSDSWSTWIHQTLLQSRRIDRTIFTTLTPSVKEQSTN